MPMSAVLSGNASRWPTSLYEGEGVMTSLPALEPVGFERRVTIAFTIEYDHVIIEGIFYGGQQLEDKLGEPS